jgi:uncharacterized protein
MSVWGTLAKRYEAQPGQEPPPRKLLALDGGGIRGILTLEVLLRIERLLAEATGEGEKFRLCDFFDYIGGTSTGAIIAAGLARGMSAGELLDFYQQTGPAMFDKAFLLYRLKYLYDSKPLAEELKETFGEETNLLPEYLKCLLWWSPATLQRILPGPSAATRWQSTTNFPDPTAISGFHSGSSFAPAQPPRSSLLRKYFSGT